jgi:hypothetical protein
MVRENAELFRPATPAIAGPGKVCDHSANLNRAGYGDPAILLVRRAGAIRARKMGILRRIAIAGAASY